MNEMYHDKVCIVTGGAAGIGRATAEAFAQRGTTVVLADIDGQGAEQAARAITARGGRAHAAEVDVSRLGAMRTLIHGVHERYGRLDFIFNNAGIAMLADLRDMTFEDWDRILGVNLHGVIYGTKLAYDIMAAQGSGFIINMSSGSGLFPSPMRTGYNTTKFGVVGLSQGLRSEAALLGIKVSVVCPGIVNTAIFDNLHAPNFKRETIRAHVDRYKGMTPQRAAEQILRGIERDRGIITLSALVPLMWGLYRLSPGLYEWLTLRSARRIRALRQPG